MTDDPRQLVLKLDEPVCWYGTPFLECVRGRCPHCRAYTKGVRGERRLSVRRV